MATSSYASKHVWRKEEEGTLEECLVDLVSMKGWKSNNNSFWPGYLTQLAIAEMRGTTCSGFGWNDDTKCIIVEKELLDSWVRSHLQRRGSLTNCFPITTNLHICSAAIERRVASLRRSRTWGLTSLLGMRVGSSELKRKKGNQREAELEIIHMVLECTNDQLRTIVDWLACALINDNHVHREFFHILHEMSELTSLDRALLQRHLLSRMDDMQGFVLMPENERKGFCRVILRDISK
ncbi:retrotransposon protein [Cucumis melo var. makuwa]|uniref:Retrotransposon protein n=1 Tax=Cucumis melo var. makuwa TaxID=1194695 RepID=A0A5D3C1X3_CUCMM|nr:retrotransposon protein [Cucumis melo var. makuwa]